MTQKEIDTLWAKVNSTPEGKEQERLFKEYLKAVDERMKALRDTYNTKEK